MRDKLGKLYSHPLVRYLAIACAIVVIELIIFQLIYSWDQNYVFGTVISFAVAVVINWYLSRKIVFGASAYHPAKEFFYVSIVSIVGLAIQLLVVYLCVSKFNMYPFLGKILSILTSFFWNYWFRAHFIFDRSATSSTGDKIDSSLY